MIPDDAIERLLEGCQSIAKQCETQDIQEWEIVASQGYGRSLDIEAGRISLASGGGEGGFGKANRALFSWFGRKGGGRSFSTSFIVGICW